MATYLDLRPEVITSAKAHSLAFHCIDGCLWLIGVSEAGIEQVHDSRNLHHTWFHVKYQRSCDGGEIDALKCESPLVNLAAHNLAHAHSRPPLAWYPREAVADVIMDRVRIYAQFDLRQFFEIAKLAGFRLSLITGREAEEGKKNKISTYVGGTQSVRRKSGVSGWPNI